MYPEKKQVTCITIISLHYSKVDVSIVISHMTFMAQVIDSKTEVSITEWPRANVFDFKSHSSVKFCFRQACH